MNLKQLSEKLGLSQTTVSRALNGYPEVSEATRIRVRQAAEQLNYRPNTKAMSLATGKAMAIGHIIPHSTYNEVVNPIFGEFIAGASQAYSKRGYELVLTVAENGDEETAYRNIAAKGVVDGIIVHAPKRNDSRIALLKKLNMPFVLHGRSSECGQEYSWLDINNRRSFYQATKLLIDLGHQTIALINGQEAFNFAWRRRLGYIGALQDSGFTPNEALMSSSELTESNGYHLGKKMLAQTPAPTAFLVSSYVMALGIRRAIYDAGLQMGKDISVIIHDDELSFFHNSGDVPQFTATRSSIREAGERSATMLMDLIDDPSKAPITQLMEAHLTIGESTGPALAAHPK